MAEAFRAASSARQHAPGLTPEQREKIEVFKEGAADISTPAKPEQRPPEPVRPAFNRSAQTQTPEASSAEAALTKKSPEHISQKFDDSAAPSPPPPQGLSAKFNETTGQPAPAKTQPVEEKKETTLPARAAPAAESAGGPTLRDLKENAKDLTAEQRKAIDLAKEFRERAGNAGHRRIAARTATIAAATIATNTTASPRRTSPFDTDLREQRSGVFPFSSGFIVEDGTHGPGPPCACFCARARLMFSSVARALRLSGLPRRVSTRAFDIWPNKAESSPALRL